MKRSNQQNRYYWGIVVKKITDDLIAKGHKVDSDDVHHYLKINVMHHTDVLWVGEEPMVIARSTSDLMGHEFEENMAKCRTWASAMLGLFIEQPNEQELNQYAK